MSQIGSVRTATSLAVLVIQAAEMSGPLPCVQNSWLWFSDVPADLKLRFRVIDAFADLAGERRGGVPGRRSEGPVVLAGRLRLVLPLRFVASGNEPQHCREERLGLRSLLQGCPPRSHIDRADLACSHGPVNRSPVELLVRGEPGRSEEAEGVRDDPDLAQASPLE